MQKKLKMTETLANGYSSESTQQELSNEHQHDRVKMTFIPFLLLVHWTKVISASEGLNILKIYTQQEGVWPVTISIQGLHVIWLFDFRLFLLRL